MHSSNSISSMNPSNPSNSMNPSNSSKSTKSILITVDLEDWFQVENLRPCYPHKTWDSCELRVGLNTHKLLDLFDRYHVQATFFVLGWVADKCPELIKEVSQREHEIASHGYNHQLCSELSQPDLRDDVRRSKTVLENITGKPVLGYRAPNFSITEALVNVLGELGFVYDSSYNNFALNKRHGQATDLFAPSANGHLVAKNGLAELPMSNLNFMNKVFPWSGGGYFRFWPTTVFHPGIKQILKNSGYYMFYCHPWEADPEQPRANGIGALSRFRHYLNLDQTLNRLDSFFTVFRNCNFISCSTFLKL
jgi:polysaccharide deacetylase family protein (PEP-CTERM system associated)